MSNIHISRLPRIADFKLEIYVTSNDNSELTAMKEAAKVLLREVIRRETYESRSY